MNYVKQEYFYLGAGDPNREDSPNYFKGYIDKFIVFNEILNDEQIKQIVDKSEYNKHTGITIIRTYDETKAFRYCQNLVENGLDATIE